MELLAKPTLYRIKDSSGPHPLLRITASLQSTAVALHFQQHSQNSLTPLHWP